MTITPAQLLMLETIRDLRHLYGVNPTLQEIADALGISRVTAFEHVWNLRRKGAIACTFFTYERQIAVKPDAPRRRPWKLRPVGTISRDGIEVYGERR